MTQAAPRLPAGFKQATPRHKMFLHWLVKAKEFTRCTEPRASPPHSPTSNSIALCHFFTRFLSRWPLLNLIYTFSKSYFLFLTYCLFKLKQKLQGSSQQNPVKISAKLSTWWLKNVAFKSANVLREGLMVLCYVMSDCWSCLQLSAHIAYPQCHQCGRNRPQSNASKNMEEVMKSVLKLRCRNEQLRLHQIIMYVPAHHASAESLIRSR